MLRLAFKGLMFDNVYMPVLWSEYNDSYIQIEVLLVTNHILNIIIITDPFRMIMIKLGSKGNSIEVA